MRKLSAEFIGTFILVFGGCGSAVFSAAFPAVGIGLLGVSLAFGLTVLGCAYALGPVSGCHLNPAVTLGVFLRGKATAAELAGYWVAQLIGAVVAVLGVLYLKGDGAAAATPVPTLPALLAEFLFTGALVFVVLNVATAKGTEGNSYFGLAIGGTVTVGAYAVGGISGGAFNPAVAVGLVLMNIVGLGDLWIYILANLAGGAAAAVIFNGFGFGGDKPVTATPVEQAELKPAGTAQ